MASKIFVNLPVKDLKKTMAFFGELGFTYDMKFTNNDAACMIIGEDNYVMLLTEPFFKGFTKKAIPIPKLLRKALSLCLLKTGTRLRRWSNWRLRPQGLWFYVSGKFSGS